MTRESSAAVCFQWGLLRSMEGRRLEAIKWLRQAVQLEPSSYWYHFYLAYTLDEHPRTAAQADEARVHFDMVQC